MKTKQDIIRDMCLTTRHDYGLPKENIRVEGESVPIGSSGMTDDERDNLYRKMLQLYNNAIEPYMVLKGEAYTVSVEEREKYQLQIKFLEERLAHSDEQLINAMDMLATVVGKLK